MYDNSKFAFCVFDRRCNSPLIPKDVFCPKAGRPDACFAPVFALPVSIYVLPLALFIVMACKIPGASIAKVYGLVVDDDQVPFVPFIRFAHKDNHAHVYIVTIIWVWRGRMEKYSWVTATNKYYSMYQLIQIR